MAQVNAITCVGALLPTKVEIDITNIPGVPSPNLSTANNQNCTVGRAGNQADRNGTNLVLKEMLILNKYNPTNKRHTVTSVNKALRGDLWSPAPGQTLREPEGPQDPLKTSPPPLGFCFGVTHNKIYQVFCSVLRILKTIQDWITGRSGGMSP